MSIRSILPRAGVAAAYLALSAGLLILESRLGRGGASADPPQSPAYLIVTNERLSPAFDSLAGWVRAEGGRAVVLTMEGLTPEPLRLVPPGWEIAYLSAVSSRYGYPIVIMGGEESVLGVEPRFVTGGVGRAPVASLDEAWAFVELCRQRGLPLDPLVFDAGRLVAGAAATPAVVRPAGTRGSGAYR